MNHILCLDCATGYIKPKLDIIKTQLYDKNNKNLYTIPCPGTYHGLARNQCKHNIDIRTIVMNNKYDLYTDILRVIYVLNNPDVHICPNKECGNIVETFDNCATCTNCNTRWCKWCRSIPYHDNMNCIEYEVKTSSTSNNNLILDLYRQGKLKFCPSCNVSTTKETDNDGYDIGCNKITCTTCGKRWCWLCNAKDIDYNHFSSGECFNKLWDGVNIV
jgi:hypothetical protein